LKHRIQAISTPDPDVGDIVRQVRQNETLLIILAAITAGSLEPENTADTEASMAGDYSTRKQTFGLTRIEARNVPDNEIWASSFTNAHSF
jgi:hypothetical protein